MRRPIYRFWLVPLVGVLALSGCSNTHNPAKVSPGSGTTLAPSGGGRGGSTTVCTIPQHNGGDHDSDNNGGPNDGDGCDV